MFDKNDAKVALTKISADLTDYEIDQLLDIPENFWPRSQDTQITKQILAAEKVKREAAKKPSDQEVIDAVIAATQLQMMINVGIGLYPNLDKVSRYHLREELKRREAVFEDLYGRWSQK